MADARILVVEDEGIVAEDLSQVLERLGYKVADIIAEGEKVLDRARELNPDLVLMDIVLKGEKSGIDVAGELSRENIPVIYVTAHADEATLEKAKRTGPFGFILKPFEEQALKSTIEMALYKHSMEKKLREKEVWFSTTVMSIGDGIIATDTESRITLMNTVAEKLTGWSREEAEGQPLASVFDLLDESGRKISVDLSETLSSGRITGLPAETFLLSRQGRKIPVDDSIAPIKDKVLGIVGAVVVFHDIIERKRAEKELRASEERYRNLFEESHDAIYLTRDSGEFILVNQPAVDLFKYTKEELLCMNLGNLFVDQARWDDFQGQMRDRGAVRDFEVSLYSRDKKELFCILSASSRLDTDGKLMGYQGIVRDVTEKRESEIENEKIRAQLMQAQKMEAIGVLAGGVAHDFNNILTVIQGNLDLALMRIEDNSDSELSSDLEAAHEASLRAADLTSQLLLFSRKQPMRFIQENLNTVIGDMLKMLHRLIGEDVSIKTDLAPDLKNARIDRGSIEQLVMNLVVNARDAMPKGGEISIRTANAEAETVPLHERKFSDYIMFSVSDTGIGIDEDIIEHIFNPFFTTKGAGKGTGLGLSVVYGIVQQHGGWININSDYGRGAEFTVYIPVTLQDVSMGQTGNDPHKGKEGSGELILVVEDEAGVREFVSAVLKKSGYSVVEAATAADAQQIIKNNQKKISLILCDVVLPDGSGLQLLDIPVLRKKKIPVVFSSGYTGERSRWESITDKGIPFLQKPFTVDELLIQVQKALS